MNEQPDRLFREKFQDYRPAVAPETWMRIHQHLQQKERPRLWLKIAAGLLLLSVAAVLIYRAQPGTAEPILAASEETLPRPQERQPPVAEGHQDKTQEKKQTPVVKRETNRRVAGNTAVDPAPESTPPAETETVPSETPVVIEPVLAEGPAMEVAPRERKRYTIVMTASEVNEKYLTKKNNVEATAGGKEASTLQKLLDRAYELKNNEGAIGSLRHKKDEILAMNFRNEKRHENQ